MPAVRHEVTPNPDLAYARGGDDCVELCTVQSNELRVIPLDPDRAIRLAYRLLDQALICKERRQNAAALCGVVDGHQ